MMSLHLLRPYMLFAFVPLGLLIILLVKNNPSRHLWKKVCDAHLLPYLPYSTAKKQGNSSLLLLCALFTCLILSLSGPSLYRQPVPIYHQQQAHVILLDLSTDMLMSDLSPNRLKRAKFKLHDLFKNKQNGQFALIAYTSEAFVVSPLTDDAQTINALLPSLTPQIMPVNGNRLDAALQTAHELIKDSQLSSADILIMTATPPSQAAIQVAAKLAAKGSQLSIIPILASSPSTEFKQFADSGLGKMILFSHTTSDIDTWLMLSAQHQQLVRDANQTAAIWRDDGRWLLLPAIVLLLMLFQRNRLMSILT